MTDSDSKRCSHCREVKPLSEFYNNRNQPDGKLIDCKLCRLEYNRKAYHAVKDTTKQKRANLRNHLITNYGLTIEEYDAMVKRQDGLCAICKEPPPQGKRLHIDHCHESNRIRGLLCIHCNRALGSLGDNLDGIMRAVRYLQPFQLNLEPEIRSGIGCGS